MNIFRRKPKPVESMVVTLHKMDTDGLRALEPKWVRIYGENTPQVARVRALITQRETA